MPTVYFTEGRYTQIHKNADNIGWHPARAFYRGHNINNSDVEDYKKMKLDITKNEFKANFRLGNFDSNAADAKLFECSSNDNLTWIGHYSRSRLMKPNEANFNPAFNEAYAKNVLKNGTLAPNEMH